MNRLEQCRHAMRETWSAALLREPRALEMRAREEERITRVLEEKARQLLLGGDARSREVRDDGARRERPVVVRSSAGEEPRASCARTSSPRSIASSSRKMSETASLHAVTAFSGGTRGGWITTRP
jgi:hypothetical protein